MRDCIFCKIVNGELATDIIYEDNDFCCFKDINPKAPTHLLLIPKKHIPTLNDIAEEEYGVMGHLFMVAQHLSKKFDLPGYRLIVNVNPEGGQEVYHLHMHILGGRQMKSIFG